MATIKALFSALRLPAKASLFYLFISIITKAAGFLVTPHFTRSMTEQEYGRFSLYISILGALSVIVATVSQGSTVYLGLSKFKDESGGFLRSTLYAVLLFLLPVCTLLFTFSPLLGIDLRFCALLSLQILFDSVLAVYITSLRYRYLYKELSIIGISTAICAPIISILLIRFDFDGYLARVLGLLIPSFFAALYAVGRIFGEGYKSRFSMIFYALRGSMPYLPNALSNALSGQADKIMISALLGAGAVAKYAVVHSVGMGLSFIVTALSSALAPWMVRHLSSDGEGRIPRVISIAFRLIAMMTLFLLSVTPEAMLFLAPNEYSEAIGAALPISLSILPSFITSMCAIGFAHTERSRYSLLQAVTSALLFVPLNFMLIPPLGYFGAGLSLFLSQFAAASVGVYFTVRFKIPLLPPISKLLLIFLSVLIPGMVISGLVGVLWLRILILNLPAVVIISSALSAKELVFEG